MFTYTRAVLYDTLKDIRNVKKAFTLAASAFPVLFQLYKILAGQGLLIFNIVLLVLATVSCSFVLYVEFHDIRRKRKKEIKKAVKTIKKWSKGISNTAIILTTVIGFIVGTAYTLFTVFFFLIAIVSLLFEILVASILGIIEKRKELFENALEADFKKLNPLNILNKEETEIPKDLQKIEQNFKENKKKKQEERKAKTKQFIESTKAKLFFKKKNEEDKQTK